MYMKKVFGEENDNNRNEWVISKLVSLPNHKRILDAGAGEKIYKKYCSHLEYISQDFAKYDGVGNRSGMQMGTWDNQDHNIISDITSIPEEDSSFDIILCTEVLEHIPNPILALTEFQRLLKPGGQLIITAPFCSLTHMAPFFYYSGFSKYFYEHHLSQLGFKIDEISYNGNYYQFLSQEIRRSIHINQQFNANPFSLIEDYARKIFLKALERKSNEATNSSDLLSYGLHIVASKKI